MTCGNIVVIITKTSKLKLYEDNYFGLKHITVFIELCNHTLILCSMLLKIVLILQYGSILNCFLSYLDLDGIICLKSQIKLITFTLPWTLSGYIASPRLSLAS